MLQKCFKYSQNNKNYPLHTQVHCPPPSPKKNKRKRQKWKKKNNVWKEKKLKKQNEWIKWILYFLLNFPLTKIKGQILKYRNSQIKQAKIKKKYWIDFNIMHKVCNPDSKWLSDFHKKIPYLTLSSTKVNQFHQRQM